MANEKDYEGNIETQKEHAVNINNPLSSLSREQLLQGVQEFATQAGMTEHLDILQRGAILAQDPDNIEAVGELSPEEKEALWKEKNKK